jgi:NAD(P)H-hydrate epimerase
MNPDRFVCTAEQAQAIDRLTQTTDGLTGSHLMQAAGVASAMLIRHHAKSGTEILVLTGPGNNGGDGHVVARILSRSGYPVTVQPLGTDVAWPATGLIVDALFGVGLSRDLDASTCALIERVNASGREIWSLDVPSGLDATNGIVRGAVVRAHHTVAMGCLKSGYFSGVGPEVCGELHLVPLGFPPDALRSAGVEVIFGDDAPTEVVRTGAHKYENGVVHVIGGSSGMSGALVMAADAAWRAGCGAVIAHMPQALVARVDASLVQPVKIGYGNPTDDRFTSAHIDRVLASLAAKPGTVLIGPGLGTDPETRDFVQAICSAQEHPFVIDADALAAIGGLRFEKAILTPHPGELAKMTGRDVGLWTDRLDASRRLASETGATIVSKGQPTAIITPDGQTRITGYSTARFARMGFGDVLAGKIAAYRSLNLNPADAARNALLAGVAESLRSNDPYPLP